MLDSWHLRHGAKMFSFAGWSMPMSYRNMSVTESVNWTRKHASLFDVSHMLQTRIYGDGSAGLLKKLLPIDTAKLENGQSKLCLFLDDRAGIIDDAIISRFTEQDYMVISNAVRSDRIAGHVKDSNVFDARVEHQRRSLLAVQGPESWKMVDKVFQVDISAGLKFMHHLKTKFGNRDAWISRSGYTGEDGFEIAVGNDAAELLADELVLNGAQLAGFAARDILRIEAGLLLCGQDMDEQLQPSEVGLAWTITSTGEFIGSDSLQRKPCIVQGFQADSPGPQPRPGSQVEDLNGLVVGGVTSGCFSPTLEKNICLAHVPGSLDKVFITIRGRSCPYTKCKLPFVKHRYEK